MLNRIMFSLSLASLWTVAAETGSGKRPPVTALKKGKTVYVRSFFSSEQDVLMQIGTGRNDQINFYRSWLVPSEEPFDLLLYRKGTIFHGCSDDAAPWRLNDTYIGGNHGYGFTIEVTSPGHGLTTADIGSEWADAKGTKFYVVRIIDEQLFWVLSENRSDGDIWRLTNKVEGQVLTDVSGRKLDVQKTGWKQIYPACRIIAQQYLVNGKEPLRDEQVTTCEFLDIVDEYDIVPPDKLLASIIANPGKEPDWVAEELGSMIHNRIVYRFLPRGTCVIRHRAKALRDFKFGYMGFTQSMRLRSREHDLREEYIPKTVPFERERTQYNFRNVQDISAEKGYRFYFMASKGNIADPANLPDRFVQFLGKTMDGRRERRIGYAIGYSLLEGMTVPGVRSRNTDYAFRLIGTRKSYPVAISGKLVTAGTEFDCLAYRQYFDPTLYPNATCVYWHKQNGTYVLYADYHKSVRNDVIKLPTELTGRQVTVVEKTPTATVVSGNTIPADGLVLSVTGDYGYVVLKLD